MIEALYRLIGRFVPQRPAPASPRRIILIQPCCIGDVVLATAALKALRQHYPQAQITWAVGSWSRPAIEQHPALNALLDTGNQALPVYNLRDFWRFVRQLRAGDYDLAVSLVRSPLMSLAVWLSGIPYRAGIDSAGRGFGYNLRAEVKPDQPRHEAEVYLDVVRLLGAKTTDCYVNVPVLPEHQTAVQQLLHRENIHRPFIIINPAGGNNPGMTMDAKRYPPQNFAYLADQLAHQFNTATIIIGGPKDDAIVQAVQAAMQTPATSLIGQLSFGEIGALAQQAKVYIGNDTGITHLAAAAGAKTVMILGPSDPRRYAPFTPNSLALWKPANLNQTGVAAGTPSDWDWSRDGIPVDEALNQILDFVEK